MKILLIQRTALFYFSCALSILVYQTSFAQSQGVAFRKLSIEKAKSASRTEKKPLFIHGFTDWCQFCKYMNDSVYTNNEVAQFINSNFISIKIDMEKEGIKLRDSLKIHNYPCLLFYDTNGELMHRAAGRKYKQPFLQLAKDALDTTKQMRTFQRKYDSGKASPAEVQYYFRMQEMSGMDAQPMINDYLLKQSDSDFTNKNNWEIFRFIFKDPTYPVMIRFLNFKNEFSLKYSKDSVESKILSLYNTHLMKYVQQLDSVGYEKEKQKIKANKNNDISEKVCAWADLNKYKMKSDWESYKKQGIFFIEKYCMNDARRLLDVSTVFYERFYRDTATLAIAEAWIIQAIKLTDQYKNNHMLASISVGLGKKEQALKAANHAIELAKQQNIDYKQTELLLPTIEKLP